MDPSEKANNNDNKIPLSIPTTSRLRNDSECSAGSDDGFGSKRHCISPQFMVSGVTGASPPKFVSLEEIMQAANGMRDMALVHQIVVDQDFKLKPAEPPANSVQKKVKETMQQAFWDILRKELKETPPNYTQALVLLEDIKKGLCSVLLPQHTKIRQQIAEVLDTDLITQQANAGVIDFQNYAQYIISVMAKLCAPVRDDKIKELTQTTDVVDTFKGILETLDLMALDMANFAIEIAKPDIIAHSVDYERKKFADYLSVQPDGLEHTREWLLRHFDKNASGPDRTTQVRNATTRALAEAYIELMEWDDNNEYPETLLIDETRIRDLQERINKLIIIGTIMLVTASTVGPNLQGMSSFKETLKQHLTVLLQTTVVDKNLDGTLSNIAEQVVQDVKESLEEHNFKPLSEEVEQLLRGQILEVGKVDHRIRSLIRVRLREFLLQIITSPTAAPQQVPTGLSSLQKELAAVAGQFLRIVSHNRAVFSQYYLDIIDGALTQTNV